MTPLSSPSSLFHLRCSPPDSEMMREYFFSEGVEEKKISLALGLIGFLPISSSIFFPWVPLDPLGPLWRGERRCRMGSVYFPEEDFNACQPCCLHLSSALALFFFPPPVIVNDTQMFVCWLPGLINSIKVLLPFVSPLVSRFLFSTLCCNNDGSLNSLFCKSSMPNEKRFLKITVKVCDFFLTKLSTFI